MINNNEKVFKINSLRKLAEEYQSQLTRNDDIWKRDISELLEAEVRYQIRNGEIVKIEIKAKPRLGKSTAGIFIGKYWIDDELKNCGKKDKKKEFGMRNLARDDQEWSKLMRNPKLMNDIIVTDEQNELEKGGENATTESQLKSVFSDVQAGRYIHGIYVSPEKEIDQNSDILIEIIGIDSKEMITHCRVYYKISTAQTKYWQPVGYLNLCVKDLIYNWEKNVKDVFFKTEKTKKDKEFLEREAERDFYVNYAIKKYEKMELITKEGILRPRELDYARAIMNVINELKELTKIMIVNDKLIRNYVEMEFRNLKLVGSIVGIKLASDRVSGILGLYKSRWKEEIKKNAIIRELQEEGDTKRWRVIEKEYEKVIEKIEMAIKVQEDELKRYQKLWEKHNEHLKEEI